MKSERGYLRTAVVAITVMLLLGAFLFVPMASGQTRWERFTPFRSIYVEHNADIDGDLDVDGTATFNNVIETDNPVISTAQNWMDDFVGDTLNPTWVFLNGSDAGAVDPALAQEQYGVMTLDGGDSGASVAADTSEIALGLHWSADQEDLVFETRLHLDGTVAVRVCAGLSDSIALEQPATIGADDTVTNVADDYAAFCYDTTAATDSWFAVAATAGVTATGHGVTTSTPITDVYQTLRIEVAADGAQSLFYVDGALVKTLTAGSVTATDLLSPIITTQSLVTDTKTTDVDYIYVGSKRE